MPGSQLALRFVPAGAKEVSFTDWSLIKSYAGAGALTGASPFEAKADFLLALTRTQAPAAFYAGSKLKTHHASWSWDTLDLDWEASFSAGGPAYVLKFPASFDLGAVIAHFQEHGYTKDEYRGVPLYTHELNVKDEWVRTSDFAILNVGVLEKQNILLLATRMDGVRHMIDGVAGEGDRERYRPAVEAMGDFRLEASLTHLVHRVGQCATDAFQRYAGNQQITARQFAVLMAIARMDGASQMDVVKLTGIDRSTLADMVGRMLGRGLIERILRCRRLPMRTR